MKLIWYFSSILTVLLILFSNPKATSFGNFGNQFQLFNYTKSTQRNLQLLIIINSLIFLLVTVLLTGNLIA